MRRCLSLLLGIIVLATASCGSTAPVCKFGLVAPFEGRYRPVGYDAIYAARLAVRQANASGGAGGCRVELAAYDDGGEPQAAVERARQLALDPQVVAVIGHFRVESTRAAWDVYAREALPLLAPVVPGGSLPDSPCAGCSYPAAFRSGPPAGQLGSLAGLEDAFVGLAGTGMVFTTTVAWPRDLTGVPSAGQFVQDYVTVSGGAQPGPYAWATYQATQTLFEALRAGGHTRRDVGTALATHYDGRGMLPGALAYRYRVEGPGQVVLLP